MKSFYIKTIVGMIILVLFAGLNLIWKFSMGNFSSMGHSRQLSVVCSVILVFVGIVIIGCNSYSLYKELKAKNKVS